MLKIKRESTSLEVLIIFTTIFLVISAFPWQVGAQQKKDTYAFRMGAARVGSGAYLAVVGHSKAMSKAERVDLVVEESGGGTDNIRLVEKHELDYGVSTLNAVIDAYNGVGVFQDKPHRNLRLFSSLYFWPIQIVVREDSPIKKVSDLAGKRITLGTKAGASEFAIREILGATGMTYDKFKPLFIEYAEAVDGIKNRTVDANIFGTGVPTPTVQELGVTTKIRLIGFTEAEMDQVLKSYKHYSAGKISAGTYPWLPYDVPTLIVTAAIEVHKDVPEDVIYRLVKALWENFSIAERAHGSQKGMTPENAVAPLLRSGLPFHPGAEKYYREIGVIK